MVVLGEATYDERELPLRLFDASRGCDQRGEGGNDRCDETKCPHGGGSSVLTYVI